jgi:hypothetical protein
VIDFPQDQEKILRKHGLVCENEDKPETADEIIQMLLDSYQDPKPPIIFPSNPLHKHHFQFVVGKVMATWKNLQSDTISQ